MFKKSLLLWGAIIVVLLVSPAYGANKGHTAKKGYNRTHLINFVKRHGDKRLKHHEAERIVDGVLQTNNPAFYLALIKTESTYYPRAISKKGAVGLGQIMYSFHHKELKRRGIIESRQDLFDIGKNIKATEVVYTGMLNKSGGSHARALSMYLGTRDRDYIAKTMQTYARLKK